LWAEEISIILLRFGFLVCILEDKVVLRFGDFERTSLSSDLVTLRGLVLVLRFGELDKVTEHKYCVSCVLMIHL
jgi:hypothetical protein